MVSVSTAFSAAVLPESVQKGAELLRTEAGHHQHLPSEGLTRDFLGGGNALQPGQIPDGLRIFGGGDLPGAQAQLEEDKLDLRKFIFADIIQEYIRHVSSPTAVYIIPGNMARKDSFVNNLQ